MSTNERAVQPRASSHVEPRSHDWNAWPKLGERNVRLASKNRFKTEEAKAFLQNQLIITAGVTFFFFLEVGFSRVSHTNTGEQLMAKPFSLAK